MSKVSYVGKAATMLLNAVLVLAVVVPVGLVVHGKIQTMIGQQEGELARGQIFATIGTKPFLIQGKLEGADQCMGFAKGYLALPVQEEIIATGITINDTVVKARSGAVDNFSLHDRCRSSPQISYVIDAPAKVDAMSRTLARIRDSY